MAVITGPGRYRHNLSFAEKAAPDPGNAIGVVRVGRPEACQVREAGGAARSPRRQCRVIAGVEWDVGLQGMAGENWSGGVKKEVHEVGARRRDAVLPGGRGNVRTGNADPCGVEMVCPGW